MVKNCFLLKFYTSLFWGGGGSLKTNKLILNFFLEEVQITHDFNLKAAKN